MIELATPVIPEYITVHLGTPQSSARNVRVTFPDYIKNVASNEIYPTWPENALRANIYAQTTFALNRIYTEHYRSQGYNFDITNSTAYDQSYKPNHDVFDNISSFQIEYWSISSKWMFIIFFILSITMFIASMYLNKDLSRKIQ